MARGSSSAQGCPPTLTHPKLSPGLLAAFPEDGANCCFCSQRQNRLGEETASVGLRAGGFCN